MSEVRGDERLVRDFLARFAEEAQPTSQVPITTLLRARRRRVRTGVAGLLVLALLGTGAFVGVRALGRLDLRPAGACVRGWARAHNPPRLPQKGPSWGNALSSMAAASPHEAWAVGSASSTGVYNLGSLVPTLPLAEHWDGRTWRVVPVPVPPGTFFDTYGVTDAYLTDVSAVSADDAWAVGDALLPTSPVSTRPVFHHWDGSRWTAISAPRAFYGSLNAISAYSASDVWAVGKQSNNTAIVHWDGRKWAVVPSPNLRMPTVLNEQPGWNELKDVVAISPDEVWAVGYANVERNTKGVPLIERWDGSAWTVIPAPGDESLSVGLSGVAAAGPDDVWAVGTAQRIAGPAGEQFPSHAIIEHWDGSKWSLVRPAGSAADRYSLTDVSAAGTHDVWAIGRMSRETSGTSLLVEHWDGGRWSIVPAPEDGSFRAIEAVPGGLVWMAGAWGNGKTPPYAVIDRLCRPPSPGGQ